MRRPYAKFRVRALFCAKKSGKRGCNPLPVYGMIAMLQKTNVFHRKTDERLLKGAEERLEQQPKYFIVDASLLPEVFLKVAQVNRSLQSGTCRTIGEATLQAGLSRSAYYKYKDGIKPLSEAAAQSIITFQLMVTDEAGVLSGILSIFARAGANILTINQSIPVNGQAVVTIAARTAGMNRPVEQMMSDILAISGVSRMEILARE